ncbi:hypothetical protein F4604DRAFT_1701443 [Suillus subluteus]|nr:hypothetical protein F4604DRAFT_1701443 [Suillus subluteus]
MTMQFAIHENVNVRAAKEHTAERPAWSRRDCILSGLGMTMCHSTPAVEGIFLHNRPVSFSGLLKKIPTNVKVTYLIIGRYEGRRDGLFLGAHSSNPRGIE